MHVVILCMFRDVGIHQLFHSARKPQKITQVKMDGIIDKDIQKTRYQLM